MAALGGVAVEVEGRWWGWTTAGRRSESQDS